MSMSEDDYLLDEAESEIKLILETSENEDEAFSSLTESNLLISENEANRRVEKFFSANEKLELEETANR